MKKLTELAVLSVMDLLIHTNGQTTTLEIKSVLRELGYLANQNTVHDMVEEIFDTDLDNKYEREDVNFKYNVYSFTVDFISDNSEYEIAVDVHTQSVSTPITNSNGNNNAIMDGAAFTTKKTSITAPNLSTSANPGAATPISQNTSSGRDPIFIFYTENHARKSGSDSDNWVVRHKDGNNEIQIFDKSLTRDQVRSRYASLLKMKMQDVRSCRFVNF